MLSASGKTETAVSAMSSAGVPGVLRNLQAHLPHRVNCNGSHGAVGEQLVPFAEATVIEFSQTESAPVPPARHISQENEAEILRRADELNARVA